MKIYPILNNLGKGKYVFIFILNERAVNLDCKYAVRGKRTPGIPPSVQPLKSTIKINL